MEVHSEMQAAEMEIRRLLELAPAQAMTGIVESYNRRSLQERDAFVAILAARITVSSAIERERDWASSASDAFCASAQTAPLRI